VTTAEFKKVGRILKEAYRQVELEAREASIDPLSENFTTIVNKTRESVLLNLGFTLEEYQDAKKEAAPIPRELLLKSLEDVTVRLVSVESRATLSKEDVIDLATAIAKRVAQEEVKPAQIIHQIVKETTVEKPQIIKETIIEKTIEQVAYDDKALLRRLEDHDKKLNSLKEPVPVDTEALKEDLRLDFGKQFQKNIDTLGMPDFRKLAMGLQAQIDSLQSQITNLPTGGGSGLTAASIQDVSSQCDGVTKTFTLTGTPIMVWGTQFPGVYQPVTDFTAASGSFTLTTTVGAPATGQTLIALCR
jgi:hypothetical protein